VVGATHAATAGEYASFFVSLRDQFGNPVDPNDASIGTIAFVATLSHSATSSPVDMVRSGNQYLGSYFETVAGAYSLSVSALGVSVSPGTPFSLTVYAGPAIAATCTLDSMPSKVTVMTFNAYVVTALDIYGNPQTTALLFF
jgi:hypothetical protein